jgi:hypothetical protein
MKQVLEEAGFRLRVRRKLHAIWLRINGYNDKPVKLEPLKHLKLVHKPRRKQSNVERQS